MTVRFEVNRSNSRRERVSFSSGLTSLSTRGIIASLLWCFFALSSSPNWAGGSGIPYSRTPSGAPGITGQVSTDAVEIGDTRLFWAYAQGFFAGYYQLSATCQDTGAHCYLFTEDAYINDISASQVDPNVLFVAGSGVLFKSEDGGQTWSIAIEGLPDADGVYDDFDSTNYNHRAEMHCVFSRAEYGEITDIIWVGTGYGSFWSTNGGVSFSARHTGMNKRIEQGEEVDEKPATYAILGHPTDTETLWAATEDGVYMTRNANRWKILSDGLPPSEGTEWQAAPAYALFYDAEDSILYTSTSKGVFYGRVRPLGASANAPIIASWIPIGGEVDFTVDSVFVDRAYLGIPVTTSMGLEITAGQYVTLVDTAQQIYWNTLVDQSPQGLFAFLTDSLIFYWPEGTSAPTIDYWELLTDTVTVVEPDTVYVDTVFVDDVLACFGYSQVSGPSLFVETDGDTVTIYLGTEESGLYSYPLIYQASNPHYGIIETITTSHDGMAIYDMAKIYDEGTEEYVYYFATNQGLFQAAEPHGEWTQLTGYILNNDGSDSVAVDTRTIAFGPDDRMYTGGHMGGFLRSTDGMNFQTSNLGLIHRNGTADQLELFLDEFENRTPADSTRGILETMVEWWGELPPPESTLDIDGDSMITILFLDVIDNFYEGSQGNGAFMEGYYDGINEYSRLYFVESNQAEMIYLDIDPLWINQAGPAACHQVFNLIDWIHWVGPGQSFEEYGEYEWQRAALAMFSRHVAGYLVASGAIDFPPMNNLLEFNSSTREGSGVNPDVEYPYAFLFALYLYEQVLSDTVIGGSVVHRMAEAASPAYHGLDGLGRLIYETTTGLEADTTLDYTPTFASFFQDLVLAAILDDTVSYEGIYGFQAVNTSVSTNKYGWYWTAADTPPFDWQLPFWSYRISEINEDLQFNTEHPIVDVVVNGDDRNQLSYYLLLTPPVGENPVDLISIPADPVTQKGCVNLATLDTTYSYVVGTAGPPDLFKLLVICTSDSGEPPTCYTFGDDTLSPPFMALTVAQNPIDDRYLDIYSFADERILPDGGQLYRVEEIGLTELEGPIVDISGGISARTGNDTTITLDQDLFFSNVQGSDFVYHIAFYLDGLEFPADLRFLAYGEDICGNEQESSGDTVTVDFIKSQVGGTLCHTSSAACLHVPPMALKKDSYILLSVLDYPFLQTIPEEVSARAMAAPCDESHFAIGPLVSAGSAGLDLSAPIELDVPYNVNLANNSEIGVYRAEGNSWIYVGGVAASETGLLRTYSWKFGQFQVFAGPLGDMKPEMPYSFRLNQNYPNPFNPTTRIQFELTRAQHVKVDIYNVMGKLVTCLTDRRYDAGSHILQWQPSCLSSGVYFLRLEAEESILYRKMMLLK